MLYIELCGTPGCGKTLLCNEIVPELLNLGYRVMNISVKELNYDFRLKLERKIKTYRYRHYLKNRKIIKAINQIKLGKQEEGTLLWKDRMLETYYDVFQAKKKKMDVCIIDEGFIQYLTSIYHEKIIDDNIMPFIRVIEKELYAKQSVIIDCHIETNNNYQQLISRNKPGDRFLTGDETTDKILLQHKRRNIDMVLGKIEHKEIIQVQWNHGYDKKNIINMIEKKLISSLGC